MLPAVWRWIAGQATSSPLRLAVVRCTATALAVVATALMLAVLRVGEHGGAVAFLVVIACSWYGGVGPSLVGPITLILLVRFFQHGWARLFDFSPKELSDLVLFLLLTSAVGWSGQMRRRAQAVARHQAAQLNEQAHALELAHIVFRDLDGRITAWHEGAQRMYGWSREEAEGQIIHQLLKTRVPKPLAEIRAELLQRGQWVGEVVHTRRDGTELIVATHWILYDSGLGKSPRVAEVNNDVTEVRRAEETIRQADRRKDQFLATLAHELRNPLAPIRTGLELLRLAENPARDNSRLGDVRGMMQRQIEQMVRLIDDLLDVSRINTGKIELRRERVVLADIIRNAVESSRPHIDAVDHKLTVTLPDEPIELDADPARISQVLLNLLHNAAKFTEQGGRINLAVRRLEDHVEISVHDTGIGIPQDMLPRVFEMFTQVDNSLERSRGGLGIGLSLVRTLVEMHGGSVEAQSRGPGQGSEFIVRLPLPVDSVASLNEQSRIAPMLNEQTTTRRVLIADDNEDAAQSLAMLLTTKGHQCRVAFDGPAAIEAAVEFQPEVLLLDLGMPGLSGYEVVREVRAKPQFQQSIFIAVTGWGHDEDRRRSREAGFDHHLVKPVDLVALQNAMTSVSAKAS